MRSWILNDVEMDTRWARLKQVFLKFVLLGCIIKQLPFAHCKGSFRLDAVHSGICKRLAFPWR